MTPQATKSLTIIQHLATGMDPGTSEPLTDATIFERPDVIRALYDAMRALELQHKRTRIPNKPRPGNAGKSWTGDEEQRLLEQFDAGVAPAEIARQLDRSTAGVTARLQLHNRLEGTSWRIHEQSRRG